MENGVLTGNELIDGAEPLDWLTCSGVTLEDDRHAMFIAHYLHR